MTDPSSSSSQADSLPSKIHQTPFPAPLPPRRRHREAQIERAYELQRVRTASPPPLSLPFLN